MTDYIDKRVVPGDPDDPRVASLIDRALAEHPDAVHEQIVKTVVLSRVVLDVDGDPIAVARTETPMLVGTAKFNPTGRHHVDDGPISTHEDEEEDR